ncbi:MAG: hypothetical protein M3173_03460 [Chloroflexota bacterium]|nr:hypothetical protein [Chloroflexota bacterium]
MSNGTAEDYRLVDFIGSTIRSVFPSLNVVDVEAYGNSKTIAIILPSSIDTCL